MSHPLIPIVHDLAKSVASQLGLEAVAVYFYTHHSPPTLRVDIRHPERDITLEDCAQMSHCLEEVLDASDRVTTAYVLEISSPGLSNDLTTDRDFKSFRGFAVQVTAHSPDHGQQAWQGTLIGRDEVAVYLNQKGRKITIPRDQVSLVQLQEGPS
ncbi:ribosome maturation factor RimP [Thermosynechococcaceae cyanobacterium BACA0444]|uniref:Ribosome maturation factor RimP n=1 Tax=Pseudocalidococcus azoricus BACA0444 TaxID=2918990 RepID=A0AAE4JV77_9CYAN|nr:ribosome maturation factor RimP [Pseudocalidococcus azoricus]MDS3859691.1 ribosome maturation factor RimP [Pseudocalidococcus azoricus BACA0444]